MAMVVASRMPNHGMMGAVFGLVNHTIIRRLPEVERMALFLHCKDLD
jgi:hypothetical protein